MAWKMTYFITTIGLKIYTLGHEAFCILHTYQNRPHNVMHKSIDTSQRQKVVAEHACWCFALLDLYTILNSSSQVFILFVVLQRGTYKNVIHKIFLIETGLGMSNQLKSTRLKSDNHMPVSCV